jgi:hypothetical protein
MYAIKLGNAPAVRGLLRCQKAKEADVLFLSETKMDERRMMSLKQRLGIMNMEVVDYEGKGENCNVVAGRDQCGFEKQIKKPHRFGGLGDWRCSLEVYRSI